MRMGKKSTVVIPKPKPKAPPPMEEFLCPKPMVACPVVEPGAPPPTLSTLADWFKVGFECMDTLREISSCGGCVSTGKG